jgi:cholesterol oxidase
MNAEYDAVVIGSGFGGSIAALRLAQAGRSVLVLERGRRYRPGEFPRDISEADRVFWRYPRIASAQGLYEARFFSGIAAVVASGLGGGSLIYANIHVRPDAAVFDDPRWPASWNRQTLDPYYDKLAAQLGVAPVPRDIALNKRDRYRDAAKAMGVPVFDPDQAVAWSAQSDSQHPACRMCAECEFGCQYGSKKTLDFNYLHEAERLGARLKTQARVTAIEPAGAAYRVHYEDLTNQAMKSLVVGKKVVVAAGTLGTNDLLLRCRDRHKTLPKLSAQLGYGYSGNGDFLGSMQGIKFDLDPTHGPDVTSVMRFTDRKPLFTLAAPTFNQAAMISLAAMGQPNGAWLRPIGSYLWPYLENLIPWICRQGFLNRPRPDITDASRRFTNLFAIGQDNANGRVYLRGDALDIEWNYFAENRELVRRMETAMRELAAYYGGRYAPLPTWGMARRIITVHSLGGCRPGASIDDGVIADNGEVHGYPGLFIADGSVIPAAIGFHPVMTIGAVAERIAEQLAAKV